MEGEEGLGSPTRSQLAVGASRTSVGMGKGKLTFTSAPIVPRAKQQPRSDFTHSPNQLRVIGRDNSILVDKIAKISARGKDSAPKATDPVMPGHLKVASISSAAVNRKKSYDKIAEENLKMYNRLQHIKPSSDIERKTLAAAHKQNEEYKKNCSLYAKERKKKQAMSDREQGWQD